jgi:ParB family chromosome partitioning protein
VIEAAPSLEVLDPKRVSVKNIRTAQPDKEFIESIRERGNFQPIGVLRTAEGELVLRFGLQRLQACIETGRQVLAMVVDGTAGTDEAEIERIFLQLDENDRRKDLTAGERAGAVAELFELGADARTVGRRTGLNKAEIALARTTAASETARTLAAQYPLDLAQAAVVAEFEDDQETAVELAKAARDNPGQFAHLAERARHEREDAAMIAVRAAELTAQGIILTSERRSWEYAISGWAGLDGRELTPETHKACPGNVVHLNVWGYNPRQVLESWFCTDPKGNLHKKHRRNGTPEKDPEEATAERRKVLEGNKAWRAATAVRQRWLRDVLLARKVTVPDGTFLFIARALAGADTFMINALSTMSGGKHPGARALLGGIEKETYDYKTQARTSPLLDSLTGTSEPRAQLVILALVVGAYEDQACDPQTWRTPRRSAQEYLSALSRWGYDLSPIEQGVIDAVLAAKASAAAAAAAGGGNGNGQRT